MENEIKESKKVKSGKKAFYKRWWFKVFAVIVVLSALTSNNDSSTPEAPEAPEMAPSTEMVEITDPVVIESQKDTGDLVEESMETEVSIEPSEETNEEWNVTIDDAMALLRLSLKDNYDNYEVYNKDDMIFINIWQDGLALEMGMAAINGEDYKESWDNMVENMQALCTTCCRVVSEDMGLSNISITLNLINDINKDLTLLSITNGIVFYDFVNMG